MHIIGHPASGNVYKPQLLLALLGKEYTLDPIKWGTPEIESPEFLAINPTGRVPVLQDDDFTLPESNAQLYYLAQGTPYWPTDLKEKAQVLSWLFWEQYSHEPYIAVIRYLKHYGEPGEATERTIAEKTAGAIAALALLEGALQQTNWLVGDHMTVADIALYAYTHVAPEAGFSLANFPAICAWIERIESKEAFVPMTNYAEAAET